jgi:hypothetical protein
MGHESPHHCGEGAYKRARYFCRYLFWTHPKKASTFLALESARGCESIDGTPEATRMHKLASCLKPQGKARFG